MATTPVRNDIDIAAFRQRLVEERRSLMQLHREQVADVRDEMRDASENELSHTSTFDSAENADTAVAIEERDRELALDENARQTINQIDHALERMDAGQYGICEVTGQPIPLKRLTAIPWATMTVEAATELEK